MFREQSGSAWKPKQDTNRGTESLKGVVLSKGGMKWSHHRLVACEPQRRIPNFVALCAVDCYPVRVLGWAVWPDLHVSCTLGGSCEARIGRHVQQHVLCLCFYQVTTCVFLLCRLFCERSGRDAAKKKSSTVLYVNQAVIVDVSALWNRPVLFPLPWRWQAHNTVVVYFC